MVISLLEFCNLLDSKGRLSLTNLTVAVLVAKIAVSPQIDWAATTAMLVAFLNYSHKRAVIATAVTKGAQ